MLLFRTSEVHLDICYCCQKWQIFSFWPPPHFGLLIFWASDWLKTGSRWEGRKEETERRRPKGSVFTYDVSKPSIESKRDEKEAERRKRRPKGGNLANLRYLRCAISPRLLAVFCFTKCSFSLTTIPLLKSTQVGNVLVAVIIVKTKSIRENTSNL